MTALLEIEDLRIRIGGRSVVDGVDLAVGAGERLGIIGESGSGKSLTCLAVLGLLPAGAEASGSIRLDGVEVIGARESTLRELRGEVAACVFQEPQSALDPLLSLRAHLTAPTRAKRRLPRREARALAEELAARVGLPDPARIVDRYPHELSGGQRQRVMIAMAMSTRPRLLLADEPTTALDVTVQARVLELMRAETAADGVGAVLVTHDMAVAASWCERLVVMRGGRLVEEGTPDALVRHPAHEYTRRLVDAAYATSWQPAEPEIEAVPA